VNANTVQDIAMRSGPNCRRVGQFGKDVTVTEAFPLAKTRTVVEVAPVSFRLESRRTGIHTTDGQSVE